MKKALIVGSVLFVPFLTLAQQPPPSSGGGNLTGLLYLALNIVNLVIPLLIAVALVVFFWGLIKYISSPGEGHENGRKIMIAGIVALFIMVSIWGIIRVIGNTLGIQAGGQQFVAPTVQYTP